MQHSGGGGEWGGGGDPENNETRSARGVRSIGSPSDSPGSGGSSGPRDFLPVTITVSFYARDNKTTPPTGSFSAYVNCGCYNNSAFPVWHGSCTCSKSDGCVAERQANNCEAAEKNYGCGSTPCNGGTFNSTMTCDCVNPLNNHPTWRGSCTCTRSDGCVAEYNNPLNYCGKSGECATSLCGNQECTDRWSYKTWKIGDICYADYKCKTNYGNGVEKADVTTCCGATKPGNESSWNCGTCNGSWQISCDSISGNFKCDCPAGQCCSDSTKDQRCKSATKCIEKRNYCEQMAPCTSCPQGVVCNPNEFSYGCMLETITTNEYGDKTSVKTPNGGNCGGDANEDPNEAKACRKCTGYQCNKDQCDRGGTATCQMLSVDTNDPNERNGTTPPKVVSSVDTSLCGADCKCQEKKCYYSVNAAVGYGSGDVGGPRIFDYYSPGFVNVSNKIWSCIKDANDRQEQRGNFKIYWFNLCMGGHYFDSNGRVISNIDDYTLCGSFSVSLYSPLSLTWEGAFVDRRTVVSFPLDPKKPGGKFSWNASSKYPLLVFDPKHKGKITEASQLFGDWTFGGNKSAKGEPVKWRDGFEALATLDKNGDGKISGEELAPLGLWFDANTNGVSEPGEVVDVRNKGLKVINLKPTRFEEARHLVIVDNGFEAEVNGKLKTGALVDWYGREVLPMQEVSSPELEIKSINGSAALDYPKLAGLDTQLGSPASSPKASDFTGDWKWKAETKIDNQVPEGYLTIQHKPDGSVEGMSVVATPVVTEDGKKLTVVLTSVLHVSSEKLSSGDLLMKFKVVSDDKQGEDTYTTVVMNSNGELVGRSVTKATNVGGSTMSVEYSWKAERLKGKS